MISRTILIAAAAALLASCGTDTGDEPTPVMELMRDEIQPTTEIFWNSAGFIIDETGEHDLTPTTDEGWQATRESAVKIGEYGKLLMTEEYARGRGDAWITFSQAMVDVSELAEKAALERNSDAVFQVGGTVYNVCSACHQSYPQTEAASQ